MKGGDWIYELDTDYRESIRSNLWVLSATPNSFHIKELRETQRGTDDLDAKVSWDEKNSRTSITSHGQSNEPIPMYMGFDYHFWGARDLGYKIRFQVGNKDKTTSSEHTYGDKFINLTADREVAEHLESFKYVDTNGNNYTYSDCFRVHMKINFVNIEEKKKK